MKQAPSRLSRCWAAWLAAMFLNAGMPAQAHRLDEYLQATLISIEKDRVQAQLRLIPGVAVLPIVLGEIDADHDGSLSPAEQSAYARKVVGDLSLRIDGDRRRLRLISTKFPSMDEMRAGNGEIQLDLVADVPQGRTQRRLIFENHHNGAIAAYLVNCLVSKDPEISLAAQNRNYQQSVYELDYVQRGGEVPAFHGWLRGFDGWLGVLAFLLTVRLGLMWWQHCRNAI